MSLLFPATLQEGAEERDSLGVMVEKAPRIKKAGRAGRKAKKGDGSLNLPATVNVK